jgi:hypothetical protein
MIGGSSTAEVAADEPAVKERQCRLAGLLALLRSGALRLIDADGTEIPRRVWLAGRWTLYRDDRGIERLVSRSERGQLEAEYFSPVFALPAASPAPTLDEALLLLLDANGHPVRGLTWGELTGEVIRLCGVAPNAFGYGQRTIERRAGRLRPREPRRR